MATMDMVPTVTGHIQFGADVVLPAIFLGRALNLRMRGGVFLKYVYLGLAGTGILLLAQTVR